MRRRITRGSIAAGCSTPSAPGTDEPAFLRGLLRCAVVLLAGVALPLPAWAIDASIWGELSKTGTLEAHFEQVQERRILKVPLRSEGSVRFERATTALIWQVTRPSRSTFSLLGKIAKMEYPELGVSERIDLAQVPDASRLATSLLVWMQADAVAVARDFTPSYEADTAVLRPKDPLLQALLSEIRVGVRPAPWRVHTVDLVEPDGDQVHITFSAVVLDGKPIPDPVPR